MILLAFLNVFWPILQVFLWTLDFGLRGVFRAPVGNALILVSYQSRLDLIWGLIYTSHNRSADAVLTGAEDIVLMTVLKLTKNVPKTAWRASPDALFERSKSNITSNKIKFNKALWNRLGEN